MWYDYDYDDDDDDDDYMKQKGFPKLELGNGKKGTLWYMTYSEHRNTKS